MSLHDRLWACLQETREGAVTWARYKLADSMLVGPYDDRGIAEPGKEHGPGFAIFLGEWRIGWWKTRNEACDVANQITDAVKGYPLTIPPAS